MRCEISKLKNSTILLSFGAGVDSTALLLIFEEIGVDYEAVFMDTGCEFPDTYEYIKYLQGLGYQIKVIKPNVEGFDNLYNYCYHYKIVPSVKYRFCTYKFKVKPLHNYFFEHGFECMAIAIDYSERYRCRNIDNRNNMIKFIFPLVDMKITRSVCRKIIMEKGLEIPIKSGCYICPFIDKKRLFYLKFKYPYLYNKAVELYKLSYNRCGKRYCNKFIKPLTQKQTKLI